MSSELYMHSGVLEDTWQSLCAGFVVILDAFTLHK